MRRCRSGPIIRVWILRNRSHADVVGVGGGGELQQAAALGADGVLPGHPQRAEGTDLQDGLVAAPGDGPGGKR